MKFIILAFIIAASRSQDVAPNSCFSSCSSVAGSCPVEDSRCFCDNSDWQSRFSCCVSSDCATGDGEGAFQFLQDYCQSFDIGINDITATCLNSASSVFFATLGFGGFTTENAALQSQLVPSTTSAITSISQSTTSTGEGLSANSAITISSFGVLNTLSSVLLTATQPLTVTGSISEPSFASSTSASGQSASLNTTSASITKAPIPTTPGSSSPLPTADSGNSTAIKIGAAVGLSIGGVLLSFAIVGWLLARNKWKTLQKGQEIKYEPGVAVDAEPGVAVDEKDETGVFVR